MNNAGELTSQIFNNICIFIGIDIEHPITHVHIQNDIVKLFIKWLQLIVRKLFIKLKLITFVWEHAILYIASLFRIKLSIYHNFFIYNLFLIYHQIYFIYEFCSKKNKYYQILINILKEPPILHFPWHGEDALTLSFEYRSWGTRGILINQWPRWDFFSHRNPLDLN